MQNPENFLNFQEISEFSEFFKTRKSDFSTRLFFFAKGFQSLEHSSLSSVPCNSGKQAILKTCTSTKVGFPTLAIKFFSSSKFNEGILNILCEKKM